MLPKINIHVHGNYISPRTIGAKLSTKIAPILQGLHHSEKQTEVIKTVFLYEKIIAEKHRGDIIYTVWQSTIF